MRQQDKPIEFINSILYKELVNRVGFLSFHLRVYFIRKYEFLWVYPDEAMLPLDIRIAYSL
jgi:hypothetical protein